eukprot:5634117-Prymnesium_polylepis.1
MSNVIIDLEEEPDVDYAALALQQSHDSSLALARRLQAEALSLQQSHDSSLALARRLQAEDDAASAGALAAAAAQASGPAAAEPAAADPPLNARKRPHAD